MTESYCRHILQQAAFTLITYYLYTCCFFRIYNMEACYTWTNILSWI